MAFTRSLFGQSGCGGEVLVLMAGPTPKGLFHRAIVQRRLYEATVERSLVIEI